MNTNDSNDSKQDTNSGDKKRTGTSKRYHQVNKDKEKIKENVAKMNGHMFQTHPRQENRDNLTSLLKLQVATEYKKNIKYLDTLFKNLEKPSIPMPILSVAEVVKNKDGKVMCNKDGKVKMETNRINVDIYNEQVKSYAKKKKDQNLI